MSTSLYLTFEKRIDDAVEQLVREQVTPWIFMKSGAPFRVKRFNGQEINYQDLDFQGTPRAVFWSRYIDPFLEALATQEIKDAVSLAKERGVDTNLLLTEIQGLLVKASTKIFAQMAEVDRGLRGGGDAKSVTLRSVETEVQRMSAFIEKHIRSEMSVWMPPPKQEKLFEDSKWIRWVIDRSSPGFSAFVSFIAKHF
ncbi:hypothetical protein ACUHMQ_13055 [Chitinimonas sp. PSY-7]|uniref:hypothetical protein n=1 Tax=Chitinimonas sp. PSY-7 TaxID=3459088 RepID=UPI00403FF8BA